MSQQKYLDRSYSSKKIYTVFLTLPRLAIWIYQKARVDQRTLKEELAFEDTSSLTEEELEDAAAVARKLEDKDPRLKGFVRA